MDIAIIGLAVEVPGADDPPALWELLAAGRTLTRPFPARRRQDVEEYVRCVNRAAVGPRSDDVAPDFYPAAFLDRIDLFDHEFFELTSRQAAVTDPQQRLILRTVYRALEDAGYVGDRVAGSRTGVYVGFAPHPRGTYAEYCTRADRSVSQLGLTGNIPTMMANRISHLLDLQGPSMVVDTACSASLVALHHARAALLDGECDLAVVAGARLILLPERHATNRIGIESSDGFTRTFDESADGTGLGEGSGALVVKRLPDAVADRDQILAVVKGSSLNHDGRSGSLTSPDAGSQARLLTRAWERAGVDPRTLGYVEAHGTATRIGDPIEVEGLTRAFRAVTAERGFCAVGSVKANIGHLFEGAGVMGLIKAVLCLQHRQIPPVANLRVPNPEIDFEGSPLRLPTRLEEWAPRDGARRCGVSAFGLGGTNAHVVLEEYPRAVAAEPTGGPYLFTLSARTGRSLRLTADALARRLRAEPRGALALADACYTSNISRSHHAVRLPLVVRDLAELVAALDGAASTSGEVPPPAPGDPRTALLRELATTWSSGGDADLLRQFAGRPPRTVSLAPYRFDESRAWLPFPEDWEATLAARTATTPQSGAFEIAFAPLPDRPEQQEQQTQQTWQPAGPGRVLALVDPGTEAASVLRAALPGVHLLEPGGAHAGDPDPMAGAAREAVSGGFSHLVFALGFEAEPATDVAEFDRRVAKNLDGLFLLAKQLIERAARLTLVVLTRKALAVTPGEPGVVTENSALAGLAKTIVKEYPSLAVRMVDVDIAAATTDIAVGAALGRELLADGPGVFALREGRVYGEHFSEITDLPEPPDAAAQGVLRPGGAYLITGGVGGLGLAIARRFAARCPGAHLYLMSRSGLPPRSEWERLAHAPAGGRQAERVRDVLDLAELPAPEGAAGPGARVQVVAGDVADEDDVRRVLELIRAGHGRLDGLVHAAGLPPEDLIMFRSPADFTRVVRPKMLSAFLLDRLTRADPPDFVVYLSSVAAVLPSLGQADYAAANYYLDTLAVAAPASRGRVLAIDWVAWRDTGMAVDAGVNEDAMFRAMRTGPGLDLLESGMRSDRRRFLAGRLNDDSELTTMLLTYHLRVSDDVVARIERASALTAERLDRMTAEAREAVQSIAVELVGRPDGRYTELELTVARCIAQASGSRRMPVDLHVRDAGVDSLALLAVTTNLSACLGYDLDPVDLLSAGTVERIAEVIDVSYGGLPVPEAVG
jgi:acyl transferase domain-containing protein/NAD(P)-dependent dehydrogenase (short-subunit alcohol dehydrogenase family)